MPERCIELALNRILNIQPSELNSGGFYFWLPIRRIINFAKADGRKEEYFSRPV
jgi:hypothetical protein